MSGAQPALRVEVLTAAWQLEVPTAALKLEVLTAAHAVTTCMTGNAPIDSYLHTMALAEQAQGLATVHVVLESDQSIVGFFTLSPLSLRLKQLSVALPSLSGAVYPDIGGYLLGRMGVHALRKDGGIAKAVVWRAKQIAQQSGTGGVFLAVDPKDDDLVGYYAQFGFERLDSTGVRRRMILSLR